LSSLETPQGVFFVLLRDANQKQMSEIGVRAEYCAFTPAPESIRIKGESGNVPREIKKMVDFIDGGNGELRVAGGDRVLPLKGACCKRDRQPPHPYMYGGGIDDPRIGLEKGGDKTLLSAHRGIGGDYNQ
jgi:hypothetical protein